MLEAREAWMLVIIYFLFTKLLLFDNFLNPLIIERKEDLFYCSLVARMFSIFAFCFIGNSI